MGKTELSKKFYKIKDVSELLGVNQSTLRFWESEFPEIKPVRSPSNRRFYTPEDIELLKIIYFLVKIKGLKIEAAKEQIRSNPNNLNLKLQIIDKLSDVRDELEMMLNALNKRK